MMRNKKLFYGILAVCVLAVVGIGLIMLIPLITPPSIPSSFNLISKYGVRAKNELNTFEGTYTKDMVIDPSITVNLSLSKEELERIFQKMIEINFFNYPEEFPPSNVAVEPRIDYYIKVEYDSKIKEVSWNEESMLEYKFVHEKLTKFSIEKGLEELVKCITDIIESKEEYKKLPSPRGGYL